MTELDDLFVIATAGYTEAELSSPHPGGEHRQPSRPGEVRDQHGRVVHLGGEAVPQLCACPPFRELIRGEIQIDLDARAAARATAEVVERRATARGSKRWRHQTVAALGMGAKGTAFKEEQAALQSAMNNRLREGAALPWSGASVEDGQRYLASGIKQ